MPPRRQVINIRGANAAGKTTLVRAFLNDKTDEGLTPEGVVVSNCWRRSLHLPIHVIGPYDASKYSGCDKIKSADLIERTVKWAAETLPGHVMFEGFRVSKSWERFAQVKYWIDANTSARMIFALLNISHADVVARVNSRRAEGSRAADPEELAAVVRQMENTRRKARALFRADTFELNAMKSVAELHGSLFAEIARREGAPA